jgi:hypothetical protein
MHRETITTNFLQTISWFDNTIIDWASAGEQYKPGEPAKRLYGGYFAFKFDGAITSLDGTYAFIYQKLGTKGLLLKRGEILKEINRSYYFSNAYEFPCAFVDIDNTTYLIHCPVAYNQLDFENVETGELITDIPGRKPADIFHSRLEISPNCTILMSKGWVWHPLEVVNTFNVKDCINNPKLLDHFNKPHTAVEICSASFINDRKILIGSSNEIINEEDIAEFPPKHVAIWDLETGSLSKSVAISVEFGNLFAINEHLAWDLYDFPKIIDLHTGKVIDSDKGVNSGKQRSSIISKNDIQPQIVFNRQTKQIAISGKDKMEILTP